MTPRNVASCQPCLVPWGSGSGSRKVGPFLLSLGLLAAEEDGHQDTDHDREQDRPDRAREAELQAPAPAP